MSNTVENRVLIFSFDNSNFERNVAQSMGTLDRLKAALKLDNAGAGLKGLDKFAKGFSLNPITNSVQALENRFSTLGIVGKRVLENMTDSAMRFVSKGMHAVTGSIISGGIRRAMNIENAHFQLQGLLKDEQKVQAVMQNAMDSVDGTAFAYDEAAKAASMFAATGLQAGDQMMAALRGITGVAAMTNSEYSGISEIFTTVAGNGRVMGMQLIQLANRGLNAAATMKDYFNGVNDGSIKANESVTQAIKSVTNGAQVAESDIRDLVTKGSISFEMFSAAMDNAFGEHAKRANETFTGAMSNIKAALARIGADFVLPLLAQNGPFVQLFNAIRERLNDINALLDPWQQRFTDTVSKIVLGISNFIKGSKTDMFWVFASFSNVVHGLVNILKGLGSVLKPIGQAFLDIFPPSNSIKTLVDATAGFKKLTAQFKLSDTGAKGLRDTFKGLFSILHLVGSTITSVIRAVFPLATTSNSIAGTILDAILSVTGALGRAISFVSEFLISTNGLYKVLSPIATTIATIAGNLNGFVRTSFGKIKEWIGEFMELPIVIDILNLLKDVFKTVAEAVKEGVKNIIEEIKKLKDMSLDDIIAKLRNFGKNAKDTIFNKNFLKDGFASLTNIRGKLKDFIEQAINAPLKGSGKTISEYANSFTSHFGKIGKAISDNIGLGEIFTMIYGGMFALTLHKTGKIVESLIGIFKGWKNPLETLFNLGQAINGLIGEMGASLKRFSKAVSFDFYANGFLKMAIGLGVLAGSIFLISKIEDNGQLAKAVGVVVGMGVAMAALSIAMKKFGSTDISWSLKGGLKAQINALFSMALAIGMLVGALKLVSTMDAKEIGKGLVTIGLLLAALGGFSVVMSKWGKEMPKMGLSFVGMAAGILIMVSALKKLDKIEFGHLGTDLIALGAIVGSLVALTWATKFMDQATYKSGFGMVGIAASVLIMAKAIDAITKVDMTAVKNNLEAFALVFGTLIGMMVASKFAGEYAARGGAGIFLMSASLITMAAAMKMISKMSPEEIRQSLDVIEEIMLVFGALTVASTFAGAGAHKAGAMIFLMAASLMLLVPVIGMLATIGKENPEGLRRGVDAIATVFTAFGFVTAMSGFTGKAKVGPMVAMTVALAGMIGALGGLAMIPKEKLRNATLAMTAIMGMFSLMEFTSKFTAGIGKTGIVGIAALGAVMGGIAFALHQLDGIDGNTALKNATSISLIMGVMSGCMYALSSMKTVSFKAVGALALLGLVVGEIAAIFYVMNKLDINVSFESAAGLSLVLATMTGVLVALAAIGAGSFFSIGAVLAGVAALGIAVAGVIAIIAAVGAAFKYIKGLTPLIEAAADAFELIGNALGRLFGGAIQGMIDAIDFPSLNEVADGLSSFAQKFAGIDTSAFDNLGKLATALLKLEGVRLLDLVESALGKVGSIFGIDNGNSIADYMRQAGEGLSAFSTSLSGFNYDEGKVTDAVNCLTKISDFVKTLDPSGGVLGFFKGGQMWTFMSLVGQLTPMGTAVQKLSEIFGSKDLNLKAAEDGMDSTIKMLNKLNEFVSSMDAGGGVLQFFKGSKMNSFEFLMNDLPKLGKKMTKFSNNLKGFDPDLVNSSTQPLKNLINAVSGIYSAGGLKAAIGGSKNMGLEGFTDNLGDLGKGLHDYATGLNGVDAASLLNVSRSGPALRSLVTAVSGIFSAGGLDAINGDKAGGLKAFGEHIGAVGEGLGEYANGIAGVDLSGVGQSVTALKQLFKFVGEMSNMDSGESFMTSWGDTVSKKTNVSEFGTGITTFADGIKELGGALGDYSTSLQGANFDVGQIEDTITVLNKFKKMSAEIGKASKENKGTGSFDELTKSLPELAKSLKGLAQAVPDVSAFTETAESLKTMKAAFEGLGQVNVGNIESIKASLQSLAAMSFDTFTSSLRTMATTMSQTMTSMTVNVALGAAGVIRALQTMSNQMASAVSTGSAQVTNKILMMMTTIATVVGSGASRIAAAMGQAMAAMAGAVIAGSAVVVAAVTSMMSNALNAVTSKTAAFTAGGLALAVAVAMGITAGTARVTSAARGMVSAAARAVSGSAGSFVAVGFAMAAGMAAGILAGRSMVISAAISVARAGLAAAKSTLGISSPSKEFAKLGSYCVTGLANGLKDNGDSNKASVKMANGVIDSFCKVMKINSPSLKMNELGHYVVQGLADGITEDMSAEDAMAKKAENIANAFQKRFNEISTMTTTVENLYKLWTSANKNASEQLKASKEIDYYKELIKYQEKAVKAAEDEYLQTKENVSDWVKRQEALNKLFEQQNKLNEYRNQLQESYNKLNKESTLEERQNQRTAINTWNKLYREQRDEYKELAETGWINADDIEKLATEATNRLMGISSLNDLFWWNYTLSDKDAATKKLTYDFEDAARIAGYAGIDAIVATTKEAESDVEKAGENLGDALAKGIVKGRPGVVDATNQLTDATLDTATANFEIHSPSRVFMRMGEYLSEGLATGITNGSKSILDSLSGLSSKIGKAVATDANFSPSITPVVDTSRITPDNMRMLSSFNSQFTVPNNEWNQKMYRAQKEFTESNERVVSAVNDLREDLNTLYTESNGEVALYVDSKKLATTIAKPMNRQLHILSKRGVY